MINDLLYFFYFQVSEDETMVKRKAPVPEPKNVDAETIYVVSMVNFFLYS